MGYTRRQFLGSAALAAAPKRRPNVLLVMSDQESALLPGPVNLPNRRRLEPGAVRFTSAFCNTPQCSAARSSLLTGLEPHQTHVVTNVDGSSLGKGISASVPNVGSVFQAAGYHTGYFGKWHLGNEKGALAEFGFGTRVPLNRSDDEVAQQAADWIRKQQSPWLAWVSVLNPHHIYEMPKDLKTIAPRPGVRPPVSDLKNLASKPSEQQAYVDKDQGRITRNFTPDDWVRYRSYYCGLVEKVDANLGTVLDAVPDLDSTVVVYVSDHGDSLGEHGLPFKGPYMYEEEIHIPLLIRAPWAFAGQRERSDLVVSADVAPTLASICGIRWPKPVTGKDLTRKVDRDAVFLEYYSKQKWINPIRTIRTRRWKMNWYDRGNKELYDLQSDPHELRNRAGDPAVREIQAQLEKRLDGWRAPLT